MTRSESPAIVPDRGVGPFVCLGGPIGGRELHVPEQLLLVRVDHSNCSCSFCRAVDLIQPGPRNRTIAYDYRLADETRAGQKLPGYALVFVQGYVRLSMMSFAGRRTALISAIATGLDKTQAEGDDPAAMLHVDILPRS